MKIEHQHTFLAALRTGINLFVGSGFSTLAKNAKGDALPTGDQLSNELVHALQVPHLNTLPLDQLSTILKATQLDEFNSFLTRRFTVHEYHPLYDNINKLNIGTIITTNIDDLIPRIYSNSIDRYLNDVTKHGSSYKDTSAVNYVPLHGSVDDDKPNYSFAATELASAFSQDHDKWHYLTHSIQTLPTLFWGYGLKDSGVLQALYPPTTSGREKARMWIMLYEPNEPTIEYFHALGFDIIIGTTQELLEYLNSLNISSPEDTSQKTTDELFPEYAIPSSATVPHRPINHFYGGEVPIWSDIFSGRIYKTRYFRLIEDKINAKRNCIIIGLAASGKTTLLMQLAAGIKYSGHKLVCHDLPISKAELLLRKLNGESALVFIDNMTNDIESFNLLVKASNVTAIGFDRDYNYEITSNRIDDETCEIINITELDDQDIQGIFSSIPVESRIERLSLPKDMEDSPSIFELIQLNTTLPKLRERLSSILQHLEHSNPSLTNLLIMMSYVHSCRTSVSFEMILAFLRNITNDYQEAYGLIQKLGVMISEIEAGTSLVETDQDYYEPRSIIFAETLLNEVPSHILKRVLLTFHNEVSPYRIYRYDVFKRRAYDAVLIFSAFNEWKEGKQFYELINRIAPSPYVLQQGALYLAKKRQYAQAFIWIDEALVESNYRILSIRNSHAIILFKANIDKDPNDIVVKDTLDQSMAILEECLTSDKRKTYHALTYADQALRYFDKFNDDKSMIYLRTAKKWLERLKQDSQNHSIYRLLRKVTILIASK